MAKSFIQNDNHAFEYVFKVCGSHCINKLVKNRKCSQEIAEDLFADALLIFRSKIIAGEIEYLTNLRAYIYRICDNNYLASIKREAARSKSDQEIVDLFYTPENSHSDPKFMEATNHSWKLLSEKCKDIIYLFHVEAISMEEIAKLLGLSNADTAKSTKSRCYKKFIEQAKVYITG